MSNPGKRKRDQKGKTKAAHISRQKRGANEDKLVKELEQAISEFDATSPIATFDGLPISAQTKKGLKRAFYSTPTDVQSRTIPTCLQGRDMHAIARTGSGKTLCFLIPLLELLFRCKWGPHDGLGAVVISPTRELAVQTFDVLRKIGGYHTFSAGLVIGGKKFEEESKRVSKMNVLIATPGRLLQHLDQAVGFDCDNLQMLVLDEADRILDMGFSRTLNAIISHFPKSAERQTLLFSATSSSSSEGIASLARLSLNNPVTLSISSDISASALEADANSEPDKSSSKLANQAPTPKNLAQHYSFVSLQSKIDTLFSFVKTHLASKIITFASTTKQVRFLFRSLSALTPGTKLFHLHGHQSLTARLTTFAKFKSAQSALLVCTDVASRGLDFPSVDWVVQMDCPEDVDAYIHRVGRTARHEKGGNGLLLLLPSEEKMVERLTERGIKIEEIKIKEKKVESIKNKLQLFAFKDPEVKYLAQRTFISYVRSIYLHADKEVFQPDELPLQEFAESLGLAGMPKVKFLKDGKGKSKNPNLPNTSGAPKNENQVRTKYDRMFERKNQNVLSSHYKNVVEHDGSDFNSSSGSGSEDGLAASSDEEDFITLARADHELPGESRTHEEELRSGPSKSNTSETKKKTAKVVSRNPLQGILPASASAVLAKDTIIDPDSQLSKRALKMGASKKAMLKYKGAPHKLTFDEDGDVHEVYDIQAVDSSIDKEAWKAKGREYVEELQDKLQADNLRDREEARERRREKKRIRKEKEKMVRGEKTSSDGGDSQTTCQARDGDGGAVAVLASAGADMGEDGYVSPEFNLLPVSGNDSDDEGYADLRPSKRKKLSQAPRAIDGASGRGGVEELDEGELERQAVAALRG